MLRGCCFALAQPPREQQCTSTHTHTHTHTDARWHRQADTHACRPAQGVGTGAHTNMDMQITHAKTQPHLAYAKRLLFRAGATATQTTMHKHTQTHTGNPRLARARPAPEPAPGPEARRTSQTQRPGTAAHTHAHAHAHAHIHTITDSKRWVVLKFLHDVSFSFQ